MPRYKFEDCRACAWRRRKAVCAECDAGEMFEEEDAAPLDFSRDLLPGRQSNSSVSNLDDALENVLAEERDREDHDEGEESDKTDETDACGDSDDE